MTDAPSNDPTPDPYQRIPTARRTSPRFPPSGGVWKFSVGDNKHVVMMDLKEINNVSLIEDKPTKKVTELSVNIPYPILKAKVITSKFGKVILLELSDTKVFLPIRVTSVYEKYIDNFEEENTPSSSLHHRCPASFNTDKFSIIIVVRLPSTPINFRSSSSTTTTASNFRRFIGEKVSELMAKQIDEVIPFKHIKRNSLEITILKNNCRIEHSSWT
ncbi:unnamed protein product [Phyllotreta striolata]|uniref:Uncharacterized protein n=1 Tax=Phyllotreta striolata TaxID=444603 RepID=A0A9N9XM16_PHYSR|nr:unnamed protein product [Phyllotreta striolata]